MKYSSLNVSTRVQWAIALLPIFITAGWILSDCFGPHHAWLVRTYSDGNFTELEKVERRASVELYNSHLPRLGMIWDTCFYLPENGQVVFELVSNGTSKLFVDSSLITNVNNKSIYVKLNLVSKLLSKGLHHVRIEYFNSKGQSQLRLRTQLGDEPISDPYYPQITYPGFPLDRDSPCKS